VTSSLRPPEALKIGLLAHGLTMAPASRAVLDDVTDGRSLSPADYASTTGLILRLEDDVWVNAPVADYNANFVGDETPFLLDHDGDTFLVAGAGLESRAEYWPQPAYHGTSNEFGPLGNYVFSHGDRVRLSPIRGCAMTCTFCNIPYDDPIEVYGLKPLDACVAAIRTALADPVQPARHLLISGGTPKPKDAAFHRELYRHVLTSFPDVDVDIMMVPAYGVLDVAELADLGVRELSINLEVFNQGLARDLMRQKFNLGLDFYLDFIADATERLGPGRVRSMLMVGLEPLEDTLAGVRAVAERGGVPVLSPFRPDPATPLSAARPPSRRHLEEAYRRAEEIVAELGVALGPDCPPCSHNTLNFPGVGEGAIGYRYAVPRLA
jgi:Radical SAM superfamily